MGKPDAPDTPDPRETSAAQTGTNVGTAIANTMMGNVNQIGADGSSLRYNQTGSYKYKDPYTGESYDIPTFTSREQLSDKAQGIYNKNQAAQGNLAALAKSQSGFLKDYMKKPWEADTGAIESHLYDLGSNTLDRTFGRQTSDLQTQLSNQGIKLGSAAYDRAMNEMGQTQNSAYTDLALKGRGQAFSELQAQRNQPINEIAALLSGSQVSMPNYTQNTPSSIATTDNAGLINNNFNQQMQNYQTAQSGWNSTVGGLFGLGSSIMMGR